MHSAGVIALIQIMDRHLPVGNALPHHAAPPRLGFLSVVSIWITSRILTVEIEHIPARMRPGEFFQFYDGQVFRSGFQTMQDNLRPGRDNEMGDFKAFSSSIQPNDKL